MATPLENASGQNPKTPFPSLKFSNDYPPRQTIKKFWKKFTIKSSGKPFAVLPSSSSAKPKTTQSPTKTVPFLSYGDAAVGCKTKVQKIVRDCRRMNQRYKDPNFDIEFDLREKNRIKRIEDCLVPLGGRVGELLPGSVKRVEVSLVTGVGRPQLRYLKEIFEKPQFLLEDMNANDVRQGEVGDCWFLSAVCALSNCKDLLHRVCVARDEKVGVYGFVFQRDGEWIYEVIDDKLYLVSEDFHMSYISRKIWEDIDMPDRDEKYRQAMQKGSDALYFAKCRNPNATWLPLLEKAYAKANGDYGSIRGGVTGQAIEDLTGGVTSEIFTSDILDKDKLWTDELMNVNKLFLFGLAQFIGTRRQEKGIYRNHAYTIMEARELDGFRLLKIKNPWGQKGWKGPWSNGSEEWTLECMSRLGHSFVDDGTFWICYQDLLKNFELIDRTRLFGADWSVSQQWTSADIPWSVQYLDTRFRVTIPEASPVVIMLCQLEDRYFRGLEGQYNYELQFQLYKDGGQEEYVAGSRPLYFMERSVSTELDLEAGKYTVKVKVIASRDTRRKTPEEVIVANCETRADKLISAGRRYDLAHSKAGIQQSAIEREQRLRRRRRDKRKAKAKEAFDTQRMSKKKEKLIRLRKEVKEKAKAKDGAKDSDEIQISIKMDGSTIQHMEKLRANQTNVGTRSMSHEGDGINFKVSVENSFASDIARGGDNPPHDEQATDAETKKEEDGQEAHAETKLPSKKEQEKDDTKNHTTPPKPSESTIPDLSSLTLSNISDDNLSWCSDVNAPPDSPTSDSSSASSILIEIKPSSPPQQADKDRPSDDNPASKDMIKPWNAVCTFGLRVYTKGTRAEIKVAMDGEDGVTEREGREMGAEGEERMMNTKDDVKAGEDGV
ncbi:MAG: hypothetical protein Q9171_004722 [Xanthocarpia ochracea]